ncbi:MULTISPECIES: TadE/TadG family type IV pilus assembly protein [Cellulomonas]|jgi:hypothetical protein|uniref:TadE/TadG family type IV pilus assembly protein n=1 Tax=Cellulomonas TaxID=1707 RepID=UPI000625BEEF|nr:MULTISPECIES: TadE/TadG family type IV pilus assembly protein [Cellulomonas]MBO9567780.1 hypothetical protein [Cellulomonas iranensis]TFH73989.1 hypothetical protein E4A51_00530 [Cellulomonas sp. HD19AZ1]UCN15719.1 hypothetical protein LFM56_05220 [Cellulomonas iranensis]
MRRIAARLSPRDDRGSAAVELVGYVTMVVLAGMLCLQGVYVSQAGAVAQQAARDGARAQALGQDVVGAARAQVPSWARLQDVRARTVGGAFVVEVDVRVPIVVRGVTSSEIVVSRDATMPRS